MDFTFKNKTTKLKLLESSKITNIVHNISTQRKEQLEKYLNEKQIQDFLNEIAQNIKNDANAHIYKNTIEILMDQYENTIKPIIKNAIEDELKPIVINNLKTEQTPIIMDELKNSLRNDVIVQLKNETQPNIIANKLKTQQNMKSLNNDNSQINTESIKNVLTYKILNKQQNVKQEQPNK